MKNINPARTHRCREYAWALACEIARERGNFTKPSEIINQFIDAGIEGFERKRRERAGK